MNTILSFGSNLIDPCGSLKLQLVQRSFPVWEILFLPLVWRWMWAEKDRVRAGSCWLDSSYHKVNDTFSFWVFAGHQNFVCSSMESHLSANQLMVLLVAANWKTTGAVPHAFYHDLECLFCIRKCSWLCNESDTGTQHRRRTGILPFKKECLMQTSSWSFWHVWVYDWYHSFMFHSLQCLQLFWWKAWRLTNRLTPCPILKFLDFVHESILLLITSDR